MNRAIERANEFNIPAGPIDFRKTQGVVKRIIPAVASTNAVIGMFGLNALRISFYNIILSCSMLDRSI